MSVLERMYRSWFGCIMSFVARAAGRLHTPFMLYGYFDNPSKTFRKFTRISSTVTVIGRKTLAIEDHVWVWHYSILDASNGLRIAEGCQIGAWVGIFTHGSQHSIRLLGREYVHIPNRERKGYVRKSVEIGPYAFIGSGSIILPGVKIGKGCIIGVGSVVCEDVPDYSIVIGAPGRVTGSTIEIDKKHFGEQDFSESYYDPEALALIRGSLSQEIAKPHT